MNVMVQFARTVQGHVVFLARMLNIALVTRVARLVIYFDGTKTPHPNPVRGPASDTESTAIGTVAVEDDESAFPEGSVTFRIHRHLERVGALPRRAKAARLLESGRLACVTDRHIGATS